MGKKFLFTLLSIYFLIMVAACGKKDKPYKPIKVVSSLDGPAIVGNIPCNFPLVKKKTSLNIMSSGYEDLKADDVYVWQKYQEMTQVNVNWTTIKKGDREQAVYTALMNRTKLDLIIRCRINATNLTSYGSNGYLLDLMEDNLLEKNAPNCWAYLQSHPDALASIMNPDGTIYGLPQINSGAELRVSRKIFINKNWLKNVNKNLPTTTEELYELLKAFKEQDANGNGNVSDEIPLCSQDWLSIQEGFYGAFGLASRGVHNQIIDYDVEANEPRFMMASNSYKDYLTYLNKLFSEELIDQNAFTITNNLWASYAKTDRIGMFISTNLAGLPAEMADNWVAVENAIEGPNGDKMWSAIRANFHSVGAAAIPSTCTNPALVLQWLDYFWTDEGTLFYHMGIEGETFVKNADGSFNYTSALYSEMSESKSFDDVIATYSPYPGGGNPTVEVSPYFMGGEMADIPASAARGLFESGPDEYWPVFTFTTNEIELLNKIQSDITKYCNSAMINFVNGTTPLSDWDSYISGLNKLNVESLISIYQSAITRYYNLLGE